MIKKKGFREMNFSSSEIPLWLDSYEDLFSDFDPRPYSHKALSQDFLEETKRASRDKTTKTIRLNFLIPKNLRDTKKEFLIKKRLREHFMKHFLRMKKEHRKTIKEGALFLTLGVMFMILATYFLITENKNYFIIFLSVFLEPGGWFLFWEGLYLVIFESRKEHPDLKFHRKMLRVKIDFMSY